MEKKEINCWNEIGIWSKQKASCPKLKEVVHCRNCPIFIQEGRRLFERAHPKGYINEWTQLLAKQKELTNASSGKIPLLLFRIEAEWFALSPNLLKEIIETRPVRFLPHRSNEVFLGLININGQLQLCVSLSGLLKIEPAPPQNFHTYVRLALIEKEQEVWAFHADEIAGIEKFHPQKIQDKPIHTPKGTFLKGIVEWNHSILGMQQVGILEEEKLFDALRRKVI